MRRGAFVGFILLLGSVAIKADSVPTVSPTTRPVEVLADHAGWSDTLNGLRVRLTAPDGAASFPAPHAGEGHPAEARAEGRAYPMAGPRLSPTAKRWLVALLLLLTFSGMLYATYVYVNNLRRAPAGQQQQTGGVGPGGYLFGGREFMTTTDVNLRSGPDTSNDKVGLAENGSRVKVLKVSGKWYQVQVTEHARPPSDPGAKDQGWVNSTLLKAL